MRAALRQLSFRKSVPFEDVNAVLNMYPANQVSPSPKFPTTKATQTLAILSRRMPTNVRLPGLPLNDSQHSSNGTAAIYSHRIYGGTAGAEMSKWMQQNGPAMEKALMQWSAPSFDDIKKTSSKN